MDVNVGRSRSSSSRTDDSALSCVRSVVSDGKSTIASESTFLKLPAPNSSSVSADRSGENAVAPPTADSEVSAAVEGAGEEDEARHRREVCESVNGEMSDLRSERTSPP